MQSRAAIKLPEWTVVFLNNNVNEHSIKVIVDKALGVLPQAINSIFMHFSCWATFTFAPIIVILEIVPRFVHRIHKNDDSWMPLRIGINRRP